MMRKHILRKSTLALLPLCVFAAVLLAVKPVQTPPLWFDEGWNLMVARNWVERGSYTQLLDGQPVRPTLLSTGLPAIAPIAASFRLLGVGPWQGRLPGALFVAGALALLYYLAARFYNRGVATATLAVALLMSTGQLQLHPVLIGREALGELPAVCYLLMGYACLASGWWKRRSGWLLSMVCWGLAVDTKALMLPFFVLSLLVPLAAAARGSRWKDARRLGAALLGSLMVFGMLELLTKLLGSHLLPDAQAPGLLQDVIAELDLAIVPAISVHTRAVREAWAGLLSVAVGVAYAWWRLVHRPGGAGEPSHEHRSAELGLLAFAGSLLLWWAFLSIGWARYLFPAVFVGSIFVALFLFDALSGFLASLRAARLAQLERDRRLVVPGAGAPRSRAVSRLLLARGLGSVIALALIALTVPPTLNLLYKTYFREADGSLYTLAGFLNTRTDPTARVESYEGELLFLLNRPYHYPPDDVQNQLNRRLYLGKDVRIDYDPLESDPDFLVDGPLSKMWQLYGPALQAEEFCLPQQYGTYSLYERVRPAVPSGDRSCSTETEANVSFAEAPTLRSYSLPSREAHPGDVLRVGLLWQGEAGSRALHSFVHVRNSLEEGPMNPSTGGDIWAQDDHFTPGNISTEAYAPGKLYMDLFSVPIPKDMPPGTYFLEIGWYDPSLDAQVEPQPETVKPPLRILWRSVLLPSIEVR